MDRMPPSEGGDVGSIPTEGTSCPQHSHSLLHYTNAILSAGKVEEINGDSCRQAVHGGAQRDVFGKSGPPESSEGTKLAKSTGGAET